MIEFSQPIILQQQKSIHLKTKLILNAEKLHDWSMRISNELSPALSEASNPSQILSPAVCDEVNRLFAALNLLSPTVALLRKTRIHVALRSICEPDAGWPTGASSRAEHLLEKWQEEISDVAFAEDPLWGVEGALAGCTEIVDQGKRSWVIEMKDGKHPDASIAIGDLGFRSGT